MNLITRYGRFFVVGTMGMVLQLTALAILHRLSPSHYLLATAVALELTLLHNFLWHIRYTWRDRGDSASRLQQCMRFHLSNGAVSMIGNLGMMRVLVHGAHMPVLLANVVAIACCSAITFCLGNQWAFRPKGVTTMSVRSATLALLLLLVSAPAMQAQSTSSLPSAPVPQSATNYSYLFNAGVFCGGGASTSPAATKPTVGCGAGFTVMPMPVFVEVGVMGPQANRSYVTGYVSVDGRIPLAPTTGKYVPMAVFGYSRLFETGHALDYGIALATPRFTRNRDTGSSMQIELRDYWTFANPAQHNVMLRVGWMLQETD